MASTVAKLRSSPNFINGLRRFSHAISIPPPPLDSTIYLQIASSPSLVLPEHDNNNNIGFMVPNSPFLGGSMELMAVPKKKVSPHKRGIRNGPKALKPVPVITRCKSTLFHVNSLNILLLANKLAGSAVESNYHISFAAVESSQVMRIVPTVDQLEVEHPT
ncbi:hypothetical protein MTR67_021286 [Solanum verrucosum]|uniref:Uncharacterized protein n=1 Tax=Solanum verrucosum TaxID=315347 RepID=A0AAF0QR79_SOLVR|nr:hypothetical protein MTR67_021286 [Solanum verrucosum]